MENNYSRFLESYLNSLDKNKYSHIKEANNDLAKKLEKIINRACNEAGVDDTCYLDSHSGNRFVFVLPVTKYDDEEVADEIEQAVYDKLPAGAETNIIDPDYQLDRDDDDYDEDDDDGDFKIEIIIK